MRLKEYISPDFQWLSVTLIEDTLSTSMPDDPKQDDGEEDGIFGDEESGEEDMNEATSPEFNWDWDW